MLRCFPAQVDATFRRPTAEVVRKLRKNPQGRDEGLPRAHGTEAAPDPELGRYPGISRD